MVRLNFLQPFISLQIVSWSPRVQPPFGNNLAIIIPKVNTQAILNML
jgi:hypothetical protein